MSDYRTADEIAATTQLDQLLNRALDRATDDLASLFYLMESGAEARLVEEWINRVHDGVRDSIVAEERVRAIVLQIEPEAERRARKMRRRFS